MGAAFARQWAKKGDELYLCDHSQEKGGALASELKGRFFSSAKEAVQGVDLILFSVKPKDLEKTAAEIGKLDEHILMSILSGTTCEKLRKTFEGGHVVRSMPNLALTEGESVIALVRDEALPDTVVSKVDKLLEGMGLIFWTEERNIDAVAALAGSGPAFILAMIEALVESGVVMGLSATQSKDLALQTILGAVALLKARPDSHPGEIRWQICSPGGTTIAGMRAFEEAGVRAGIMDTILATYWRAKEPH